MRIVKIDNNPQWPFNFHCNNCPATFEVSEPSDMEIVRSAGDPPTSTIVVKCPVCGREHTMPESVIPYEIQKQIPISPRSGIMACHD